MKATRAIGLVAAAGLLAMSGGSPVDAQQGRPPVVDKDHLRMEPEQGLTSMTVLGDPSKPGIYVVRNRFAAGNTSRPHFHDQDRFVTVIKGTWYTDEGDVFRPDKMVPIREGGFMYHPAGLHHYDGSRGEEVIVQIMGMGPVKTTQTEVDESGKPVGANPAATRR